MWNGIRVGVCERSQLSRKDGEMEMEMEEACAGTEWSKCDLCDENRQEGRSPRSR